MNERKHTPGPWHIRTLENFGFNVVHYRNGDQFDILRVAKSASEDDARLIAAAPDMLEALKLHVAYENTRTDRGGKNGPKGKAWAAFVAARDAALAKAGAA